MAHPADGASSSALTVRASPASVAPALVLPPAPDAPSLGELFTFMRDAERRFETLRMRLVERVQSAGGETVTTNDVWLHHPGRARVVTYTDPDAPAGSGVVWVSDGSTVRTYDGRSHTATARPARPRAVGIEDPHLPAFGRAYRPLTQLPADDDGRHVRPSARVLPQRPGHGRPDAARHGPPGRSRGLRAARRPPALDGGPDRPARPLAGAGGRPPERPGAAPGGARRATS